MRPLPCRPPDQPTEAAPVWERFTSSRCATPTSARISTVTCERSNATLWTLALNSTETSTTGCLMNTQTVSIHQQIGRLDEVIWSRDRHRKRLLGERYQPENDELLVIIHCGSCKYESEPKTGRKHIMLECGWV